MSGTTDPSTQIADLQRVANELEKPPTTNEYDEHGKYTHNALTARFGGWETVLSTAGLSTDRDDRYTNTTFRATRDQLVADLQNVADELGHPPRTRDHDEHGEYDHSTHRRRFGSWGEALEAAGLDPDERPIKEEERIPDEVLVTELQVGAMALGHSPSSEEMRLYGEYSATTYRHRFGSWSDALEAADLPPTGTELDG